MKNSKINYNGFLTAHYWLLRHDFETIGHFRNFHLKYVKIRKFKNKKMITLCSPIICNNPHWNLKASHTTLRL